MIREGIRNRAYRYRIYPTAEQEEQMEKTFGCCRFVYNHYLELQSSGHKQEKKHKTSMDCNNDCNRILKEEHPWLREVDKFALTNAIYALDDGFKRFFRKQGGYPNFKSRHRSRKSYTTNMTNGNISVGKDFVKLPKLGKVKAVIHRQAEESFRIKQATVSMESDGSCYASVLYEYEREICPISVREDHVIGLDYKSNGLYMDSEGMCCCMPHFYRENQKKLAKEQRKLRHKILHSNNYNKQKRKIAKRSRKTANQRNDYLHKQSTAIAKRYDLVCIEDLNMRSLSNKGFGNGKATMDNGYGAFTRMLEYKLADRGKKLIRINRWYPSTKRCSYCGALQNMDLKQRVYRCRCGLTMDRDWNAAVNIRNEGYRMYQKEAV